jgi:hypothetical protein
VLDVQIPFDIVHLNVADVPAAIPVTVEVAEFVVVIVAVPLTTVQRPVPLVGVLPANVKLETLH